MIERTELASFRSFEEAEEADRRERWAMSPEERLIALERLRSYMYPDAESPPRLQRVFESVELPRG
jgi:hypothetical protein